jgi:hypothetical protein
LKDFRFRALENIQQNEVQFSHDVPLWLGWAYLTKKKAAHRNHAHRHRHRLQNLY